MKRTLSSLLLILALVLVAAACGDDDETTTTTGDPDTSDAEPETPTSEPITDEIDSPAPLVLEPDDVVFVWTETGGCFMAGPNCARYEVRSDGTVATYREGDDSADPAATGTIAADLLAPWVDAVRATDLDALVGRLGPGEMTAAFDGVDTIVSAPFADITLSSVDVEFDTSEAFFAEAAALARAAADAAPLTLEQR